MTSIAPLLVVEDVTIAFGELVVLRALTFHVDRGDSRASCVRMHLRQRTAEYIGRIATCPRRRSGWL